MNGVTGRMGKNQHLLRSILPIIEQGGVKVNEQIKLLPKYLFCKSQVLSLPFLFVLTHTAL